MKATKKSIITLCIVALVLAGFALAQASDSPKDTSSTESTAPSTANSTDTTAPNNQADATALVLAIESDGDLMDVAEAISVTGTDVLVATMPEGVTIFAPVDGSFAPSVVIEDVITEYIVPVMLDTTDMVADTVVTSVDGTPIEFTVFDEEIMVNGVPLVDLEGIYSGNVVIYKLTDSFDEPAVASTK